jgi:hypothetical protein
MPKIYPLAPMGASILLCRGSAQKILWTAGTAFLKMPKLFAPNTTFYFLNEVN